MIYSSEINKVCGLCQMAEVRSETEMFCSRYGKTIPVNEEGCKKFKYDILKKKVRRMRRLKTNYNKEHFTL